MKTLTVELGTRSYPIFIGSGLLQQPHLLEPYIPNRALLVTNNTLAPLYLKSVTEAIAPKPAANLVLKDGEQYKSMASLESIFETLLKDKYDRQTTLIALGGGVIGDLTGFAAACYQRGIAFIQIPTSLLAQVDSSVGGKTAVNHRFGKNMIGAFHQPKCVLIDVDLLQTLPAREFKAGLAEVIKYGLINDLTFFTWLEQNIEHLLNRNSEHLIYAIEHSCTNKAKIVAEDETEQGRRALLNLGHTFGHAIETLTAYQKWNHGEAVGIGMCMAAHLSSQLGLLQGHELKRCTALIKQAGLPTQAEGLDSQQLLALMHSDKKNLTDRITLILLNGLGTAEIKANVSDQMLLEFLNYYQQLDPNDV